MRDRANRIAMMYLSQVEVPKQEPSLENNNEQESKTPDVEKKRELVREYLSKYYPNIIYSFMKQYSTSDLFLVSQAVVSRFNKSDTPLNELEKEVSSLQTKILSSVGDVAENEKDSLTDTFMEEIMNRGMTSEAIEDFVQTELFSIKVNAKNALKRSKGLLLS